MSEPQTVVARWTTGHEFEGGRPERPTIKVDGDGKSSPSPVDTMLVSIGTCPAVDVIDILAKRRTPIESLEIEVVAQRVDTIPRHLKHVLLIFRIGGAGIERIHAERAVDLAVNKYCSVRDSIRPDVPIEWKVELNGVGAEG